MPYINIDVELTEFDTQDLIHELARRDTSGCDAGSIAAADSSIPPLNSEDVHPLHRVYYRLKLGDEHGALAEMRTFLGDELGVIL